MRHYLHMGIHFVRIASDDRKHVAKTISLNSHAIQIWLINNDRFNHYIKCLYFENSKLLLRKNLYKFLATFENLLLFPFLFHS